MGLVWLVAGGLYGNGIFTRLSPLASRLARCQCCRLAFYPYIRKNRNIRKIQLKIKKYMYYVQYTEQLLLVYQCKKYTHVLQNQI